MGKVWVLIAWCYVNLVYSVAPQGESEAKCQNMHLFVVKHSIHVTEHLDDS